ncbi:tautomerase family protein [Salicibibacter kimchii]|uniref:tautomerase family protein n=1 Tax=Salicibibacter kimchii TaxID=2099786 RepID=UPI001D042828|nr:tautomerase family protein [Salicibibacter kimchii]
MSIFIILQGRETSQKKALIKGTTDVVSDSLGVEKERVRVLIHEIPSAGGVSMAEE